MNSRFLGILSRKFLVLAVGTGLLLAGKIGEDVWFWLAVAYIGSNVLLKGVVAARRGKR